MIKKIFCFVISFVLIFASVSCGVIAETDEQFDATEYPIGDVNCDREIDVADCLQMVKVLLKEKNSYLQYENADLNGDSAFNLVDLLFLKKLLANIDVEINTEKFARPDEDITEYLDDLGKNNFNNMMNTWDDSSFKLTVSRNPYDMITMGNRVLVSGGNYQDNTGPVRINSYYRESDSVKSAGTLGTEQVNRFYKYDGLCFALSIDSRYWGSADVYVLKNKGILFQTLTNVLQHDIHCYDMTKYNGKFFFAGSAVNYDSNYKNYSGENLEMSKSIIYQFTGEDITKGKSNDFNEVELVNKFGDVIDYTSNIHESQKQDGTKYYISMGVPRVYDFFERQGNLYALYYDQYASFYDEYYNYDGKYDFNGLYKYDDEKGQFIYDSSLKIDGITNMFEESQDKEKINHDFEWNGKYYFISDKMLVTDDFINYSNYVIPGYETYSVYDIMVRSGKLYLLCSTINSKGGYKNYVLETADMESFRPILNFNTATFARSFEFCNGAFFFGLGARIDENNYINTECGRILRYTYYK